MDPEIPLGFVNALRVHEGRVRRKFRFNKYVNYRTERMFGARRVEIGMSALWVGTVPQSEGAHKARPG